MLEKWDSRDIGHKETNTKKCCADTLLFSTVSNIHVCDCQSRSRTFSDAILLFFFFGIETHVPDTESTTYLRKIQCAASSVNSCSTLHTFSAREPESSLMFGHITRRLGPESNHRKQIASSSAVDTLTGFSRHSVLHKQQLIHLSRRLNKPCAVVQWCTLHLPKTPARRVRVATTQSMLARGFIMDAGQLYSAPTGAKNAIDGAHRSRLALEKH